MKRKHRIIIISSIISVIALGTTGVGLTYALFQKSAVLPQTIHSDGFAKTSIFLNPKWGNGSNQTWDKEDDDKTPVMYAYAWDSSTNKGIWYREENRRNAQHNYHVFLIPTKLYDSILFARVNPDNVANLTKKDPASGTIWNQTGDLNFTPATYNLYQISSWHTGDDTTPSDGSWSPTLYSGN